MTSPELIKEFKSEIDLPKIINFTGGKRVRLLWHDILEKLLGDRINLQDATPPITSPANPNHPAGKPEIDPAPTTPQPEIDPVPSPSAPEINPTSPTPEQPSSLDNPEPQGDPANNPTDPSPGDSHKPSGPIDEGPLTSGDPTQ